jgi:hypothetical protein
LYFKGSMKTADKPTWDKQKKAAYDRANRKVHADRRRVAKRAYREAHAEEIAAHKSAYAKAHPEKSRERLRRWNEVHPYSEHPDNPETARVYRHKRRAREIGGGSWTAAEWQTLKQQLGYRCVGCWKTEAELKLLGRKLVPDHIVSVAKWPKGQPGLNDITNIQPLCHGKGGCNNKKHDKCKDFLIS